VGASATVKYHYFLRWFFYSITWRRDSVPASGSKPTQYGMIEYVIAYNAIAAAAAYRRAQAALQCREAPRAAAASPRAHRLQAPHKRRRRRRSAAGRTASPRLPGRGGAAAARARTRASGGQPSPPAAAFGARAAGGCGSCGEEVRPEAPGEQQLHAACLPRTYTHREQQTSGAHHAGLAKHGGAGGRPWHGEHVATSSQRQVSHQARPHAAAPVPFQCAKASLKASQVLPQSGCWVWEPKRRSAAHTAAPAAVAAPTSPAATTHACRASMRRAVTSQANPEQQAQPKRAAAAHAGQRQHGVGVGDGAATSQAPGRTNPHANILMMRNAYCFHVKAGTPQHRIQSFFYNRLAFG
jgi:hypothetical protein